MALQLLDDKRHLRVSGEHYILPNLPNTLRFFFFRKGIENTASDQKETSSTAVVERVSPSTPNPSRCSRRERPKDLAALQANDVLQRRNQACLIDNRSCGGSLPPDSQNLKLHRTISHQFNPTPPDALPPRGRAKSGQVFSCSIVVRARPQADRWWPRTWDGRTEVSREREGAPKTTQEQNPEDLRLTRLDHHR